jgi:hypothetical protein
VILPIYERREYPRIVFTYSVGDLDFSPQGYRGDIVVELSSDKTFPMFFYEASALVGELEARAKHSFGRYVAEPGLVVLTELTIENIRRATADLIETNYFTHMQPINLNSTPSCA